MVNFDRRGIGRRLRRLSQEYEESRARGGFHPVPRRYGRRLRYEIAKVLMPLKIGIERREFLRSLRREMVRIVEDGL